MDITITIIHISKLLQLQPDLQSVQQVPGHNVLTNCKWLVSVCLTNYAPCCPAPDLNNILYVTVTSNNTAHCHHTARGQLGTDNNYLYFLRHYCLLYLRTAMHCFYKRQSWQSPDCIFLLCFAIQSLLRTLSIITFCRTEYYAFI